MVLDLIAIGVGIYLLARHKRSKRERAAAFAAGRPLHHGDGSVTYPPAYEGPWPTPPPQQQQGQQQGRWQGHGQVGGGFYDEKRQQYRGEVREVRGEDDEEVVPRYTDAVPSTGMAKQGGAGLVQVREPEVREVRSEKEEYVHV